MVLSPADKRALSGSKRIYVQQVLEDLKSTISACSWTAAGNRYAHDPVFVLRRDHDNNLKPNGSELAQYIAASCLLHASDGWSYLGRALQSLLRGDPHRARHLAYYAELRASTALLASEGVGIFNQSHFVITGKSSVASVGAGKGTHQFQWDCLDYWSSSAASGQLFARMIRPYGLSLDDWFSSVGGATAIAPLARDWLKRWGVDIQDFPNDRNARNLSSYQPDGIPSSWSIDGQQTLEFARDLWSSLEPSIQSRFEVIDRHILRLAMARLYEARHGKRAVDDSSGFQLFAEKIIRSVNLSASVEAEWLRFMIRGTEPHDAIIFKFSERAASDPNVGAHAVLSRATLLLRLASGSTAMLYQEAGYDSGAFSFWADSLGQGRGIWEGASPDDPMDLWADVFPTLEDVESFQQKHNHANQSFRRIGAELSHALVGFGECERVAIWSMAI